MAKARISILQLKYSYEVRKGLGFKGLGVKGLKGLGFKGLGFRG